MHDQLFLNCLKLQRLCFVFVLLTLFSLLAHLLRASCPTLRMAVATRTQVHVVFLRHHTPSPLPASCLPP
jgi:hypothetical protein